MGSATLLMISLAQLFSLKNETTYKFCDKPHMDISGGDTRMSFFIESPAYPKTYDANKDCTMKFKLPDTSSNGTEERSYTLYLSCTDGFKMQDKPGGGKIGDGVCSDFLQVDEIQACGTDLDERRMHHIITGPIKKNGLMMRFLSDADQTDTGFRCHGMIDTKKSCSMNVFLLMPDKLSEVINGMKLKKIDNAMIDCTFKITVDAGYHLKLSFLEFNLDPADGDYCISIGAKVENL